MMALARILQPALNEGLPSSHAPVESMTPARKGSGRAGAGTKEKPPEAAFRSHEWIAYAAFSAIAFFRRYTMKPTPANPKIIIAQVEGSGTAPTVA
jgi:hypothetical protein